MLDDNTLKNMEGSFKSIKPLTIEEKKPKVEFMGEAAADTESVNNKSAIKIDSCKPRDLSVEVQKALPLMNDNSNWQKRKDGAELLSSQL